ncbi:MAG: G1 family glutamic endopeptidase [Parachlamydiaceae bacterium]
MRKYLLITCALLLGTISILSGHIASDLDTFLEIECTIAPRQRPGAKDVGCSQEPRGLQGIQITDLGSRPHMPFATARSTNWSGYVAQTSLTRPIKGSVTSVAGEWNVPALTSSTNTTYCAVWVGIDGFSNGTVEQIGTEHEWYLGAQVNYAWFEMYPGGSYELVGFPVNVHDLIGAEVNFLGGTTFQLIIINYTRNVYTIVPKSYTKSAIAQRTSAEWVVEAPYYNGILPLSHFGTIPWTNCAATMRGHSGPINYNLWANESINMVTISNALKALPSSLVSGGKAFSVTWMHE